MAEEIIRRSLKYFQLQSRILEMKAQGTLDEEKEALFLNMVQGYFKEHLLTRPNSGYYFETLKHISEN